MILDRVLLDNFGAYAGRQEALLTPESGKPVILFGGMNGGGKTTLLDSIQLGFYGSKARLSNRGRLGYRAYLAQCIHRGVDPDEGASITIQFHRTVEGQTRRFEIQRAWRKTAKEIEETVHVTQDGEPDELLTEHWEETLEAWLPAGISHLFFFDGEQIKDLAEGRHAAEIIGTALHSLLGLDLVDRLETDLKVFERRKRSETLDSESLLRIKQAEEERNHLDEEQAKIAQEEGQLVNEAGRLAEKLRTAEEQFQKEGGELFLRRKELAKNRATLESQKHELEERLRSLAAGPLPLLLLTESLHELESQARKETEIQHARVLSEELGARDEAVLELLKKESVEKSVLTRVSRSLTSKRRATLDQAKQPILLNVDEHFAAEIAHLRDTVLPEAQVEINQLLGSVEELDDKLDRLDTEIARVPEDDRIAAFQEAVAESRKAHEEKIGELEQLRLRKAALQKQYEAAEKRLDQVEDEEVETRHQDDERQRLLLHSARVRDTLEKFRVRMIRKHAGKIESLMLESFQTLLRKSGLVTGLTIDPESFEVTLFDRQGNPLPFDRLSAGERQLLATSLLWGLARASGRPVPTIIDTPLGRLDSSHRKHLIERYFPAASHQVLLLSTDEEIVGDYLKELQPFITRTYHLAHDETLGSTHIEPGYFPEYETAR